MKFLVTLVVFTIVAATLNIGFAIAKRKYRQGTPTDTELVELGQEGNCSNAVYNASKGSIRFPHSNSGEGPGSQCRYSFNITDTTNKTYLPVIFLVMQTAILSPDDHLAIFDGIMIRKYSGHLDPFVIMVDREKAYISLNASNNAMQRKMTIVYSAESCLLNHQTGPPVKITSPIYTKKDHQTFNCTWIISADPEYRIYLQFTQFNIMTGNVTVQSGANGKKTYSGTELPDDYMTTQPNIRIIMQISTERDNESFSAIYTFADEACSTVKEISGPNTFRYPNDASILSPTCINVHMIADDRMKITGKIESSSEMGSYAVAVVNDGESHNRILAMHSTDDEFASYFVTSGPKVVIFYHQYGIGASANVSLTTQSAGGYYDAGIVEITKPVNQEENSVLYTLGANKGNLVRLTPIGNVPLPNNCTIEVYDKDETKLLARFSKEKLYEIISNSDRVLLNVQNFHSDTIKFNFTEVSNECSGFGSTKQENFHIVNQKSYVGSCVYTIRITEYEESDSISLHINGANLEKDDGITILEDGKLIFQWNQTDFMHGNKLVYGNAASMLVVQFEPGKSRTQTTGNAVSLVYALKKDCRGVITVNKNTTITSPRYPNLYPLNAHCNWTLVAPANKTLLLSFKKIQLSSNESLQVREEIAGNETILYSFIINDTNPDDIITSGNKTSVIFNAPSENYSRSEPDYGFLLEAYVLDCGGHIKNVSGVNSTPNFPAPINSSMFCAWILEVPENQIIRYTFRLESSPHITNGSLTFHDGGSLHFPVLSLQETLTGRNKLLVTYQYIKNGTDDGAAFQIAFKDSECSAKCLNGLCLRNEWRCNRIDECGDRSDEIDCPFNPAAIYNGVAVPAFVGALFVFLIIGIAAGYFAPLVIHRIKNPRHYQEFRPNIVDE